MDRLEAGKHRNMAIVAKERGNEMQTDTSKKFSHVQRKVRKDKVQDIAKECVVRFCQSGRRGNVWNLQTFLELFEFV